MKGWIDKTRRRYQRWQFERRWRKATPGTQVAGIIEMLHHNEPLRRAFRDALYGKTHPAVAAKPRRGRR